VVRATAIRLTESCWFRVCVVNQTAYIIMPGLEVSTGNGRHQTTVVPLFQLKKT